MLYRQKSAGLVVAADDDRDDDADDDSDDDDEMLVLVMTFASHQLFTKVLMWQ